MAHSGEAALECLFGTGNYESYASYENGVNSHACKPVSVNPFIETVKQPGLYWLILDQVPVKRGEN